jgi:hypothetical protein
MAKVEVMPMPGEELMTEGATKHLELERRLEEGWRNATLTEVEEDVILEEMGDLWWEMTENEHADANRRAIAWPKNPKRP